MSPDFEIVGLLQANNGRSCCQHAICGVHLENGDLVRLVNCVVTVQDEEGQPALEEAIKIVKIIDGADACTVGFVPRIFASLPKVKDSIGKFATILEIYEKSDNSYKRKLAKANSGMAKARLLADIPMQE